MEFLKRNNSKLKKVFKNHRKDKFFEEGSKPN